MQKAGGKDSHMPIPYKAALDKCLVACAALSHLMIIAVDKRSTSTIGLLAEALLEHKEKCRENHDRALFSGQLLVAAQAPKQVHPKELPKVRISCVVEDDKEKFKGQRKINEKELAKKAQESEYTRFKEQVAHEVKSYCRLDNKTWFRPFLVPKE